MVSAAATVFYVDLKDKTGKKPETQSVSTIQAHIDSLGFTFDVADTDALRQKGLGGRVALSPGQGMLFVFDHPDQYGFWMKDMLFSIDILWLDDRGSIVTIAADVSTSTYPQIFYPQAPSKYVVEILAGESEKNHLKIGDKFFFQNNI